MTAITLLCMKILKIEREISSKKQTVLNMASTVINYVISLSISFFLTPFIVKQLGTAAYGFIGLSNNIIGYTALLTVAINSMAGRFVTIHYHNNKFEDANKYISSTFFSNVIFALIIITILGIITIFLEYLTNIPLQLVSDVKFLFVLLFVNSAISLVTGVFNMSTFIKNRLELSNIRSMGSSLLRAMILLVLYGFFPAHIWYMGCSAILCTIYIIIYNYNYFKKLTPELYIHYNNFDKTLVKEMTKEGSWNVLNNLNIILNQGVELLIANLFIGAYFMGVLSISKTLPWMILGLFTTLANNFQPEFIKYYAQKKMDELKNSLIKSIRILGLFTSIPCAIIISFGDIFYTVWVPQENITLLYGITCVIMCGLIFTMPSQSLWYIFTMTKTLKKSTLNTLIYSILNITITISVLCIISDDKYKLFTLVTVQSVLYMIRYLSFVPLYGAKVLGYPRDTLLFPILKVVLSTAILTAILIPLKLLLVHSYSWISLIAISTIALIIGLLINYRLSLTSSDRQYLKRLILKLKTTH